MNLPELPPAALPRCRALALCCGYGHLAIELAMLFEARGTRVSMAPELPALLDMVRLEPCDLLILHTQCVNMRDPMTWAALRYAFRGTGKPSERGRRSGPPPVLLIAPQDEQQALESLRTLRDVPSTSGYNSGSWRLGLLEWPCPQERLFLLAEELAGVVPAPA